MDLHDGKERPAQAGRHVGEKLAAEHAGLAQPGECRERAPADRRGQVDDAHAGNPRSSPIGAAG
jgi:hypothetical protein